MTTYCLLYAQDRYPGAWRPRSVTPLSLSLAPRGTAVSLSAGSGHRLVVIGERKQLKGCVGPSPPAAYRAMPD